MRDAFAMFAAVQGRAQGLDLRLGPDPAWTIRCTTRRDASPPPSPTHGWMIVTGAGPGIMEAGMEGAGRSDRSASRSGCPFESGANSIIAGDAKHVSMKYFFTRKLMLIKESQAFVCLPGGFGTLDETFELLTLTQTGKGLPGADRAARCARAIRTGNRSTRSSATP